MKSEKIPILIEPTELESRLPDQDLLIVDLCQSKDFREQHIPGSMHLDYSELIDGGKPAAGLLPAKTRSFIAFASRQLAEQLAPRGVTLDEVELATLYDLQEA